MKITIVAGARPNFMKISPIIKAIEMLHTSQKPIQYRLIHTGQHYNANLSDTFFFGTANTPSAQKFKCKKWFASRTNGGHYGCF